MAPSAVMGSCTPALMSTANTAAQNVAAYTTAAQIALNATFGNVCLPPGILPFATVTLTQAFSGVHTIGALPIQTFYESTFAWLFAHRRHHTSGKRRRIRTGFHRSSVRAARLRRGHPGFSPT